MKVFKQIACMALVLVMLSGLVACAPKEFEHQTMMDFCEEQDMDECDDLEEFFKESSPILGGISGSVSAKGVYYSCKKSDAQEIYDKIFNRFAPYPSYDVEETTAFTYCDEDGLYMGFLFTMEDEKDAKKLLKKYIDQDSETCETGTEKGCEYFIDLGDTPSGKPMAEGFYLIGKTVVMIKGISYNTDFADDFSKAFKVKSPTELD